MPKALTEDEVKDRVGQMLRKAGYEGEATIRVIDGRVHYWLEPSPDDDVKWSIIHAAELLTASTGHAMIGQSL